MDLVALRVWIYQTLVDTGVAPMASAVAAHWSVTPTVAGAALETLHDRHELFLHPETREIWMAGPFSALPTPFRVRGRRASYWPRCAWDVFGIAAFLGESVTAEGSCADCGDRFSFEIAVPGGPADSTGLVHILVPARDWYKDVGFT